MQQVTHDTPRRDPAPSRWAYRVQRLWLTPLYRALMRVGVPVFIVVFFAGLFVSDPANRETVIEHVADVRRSVAERPEFMVKLMAIDGASVELDQDIREVLPVDFPISSFDMHLEDMKKTVAELDAVAAVDLHIRPGGILQIEVSERIPAVVWRNDDMLELLDAAGHRVAALSSRARRTDLPLIVGQGAERHVPEALRLISAVKPLEARLRGLVRMGERRWDVVLDRGQRILLPETAAVQALEQVIALDQARDLLDRDLSAVDMRNVERPTLRMAERAVEELRRIKMIELGETIQ